MKTLLIRTFLAFLFAGLTMSAGAGQTRENNNAPLTNASVVKLVRGGFKEKTIISIIATLPSAFDLSPERMIELKRSGVTERIILAMLARQQGVAIADDTWTTDDLLSDQSNIKQSDQSNNKQKERQRSNNGDSADIFGSSGSVQGSTRSRGGNSSISGDTELTGSATVRIIRPPTEAGAPPKLEKTAALNNDSIIELVEAGFSDGTIIRRIEKSPVEFDFSPAKVDELRKHRVSDKILAAMKAATGDDSNANKTGPSSNGTPRPE